LALRRGNLPPQRSPQPPHLGFAAFDHLFPESDGAANHTSGNKNNQQFPPLTSTIPIQAVMEVVSVIMTDLRP
jgi:hypothetical protein